MTIMNYHILEFIDTAIGKLHDILIFTKMYDLYISLKRMYQLPVSQFDSHLLEKGRFSRL